jgi:hypothetical protein
MGTLCSCLHSAVLGVIVLAAVAIPTAQAGAFADDLLRRKVQFSAADLQLLDAGARNAVRRYLEHVKRQVERAHPTNP